MTRGTTTAAIIAKNRKNAPNPMSMLDTVKSASVWMTRPPTMVRNSMEMNSSNIIIPSKNSVSGLSRRPSSMRVFMATAEQLMASTEARNKVSIRDVGARCAASHSDRGTRNRPGSRR